MGFVMRGWIQLLRTAVLAGAVLGCYPKGWSGMSPMFVTTSDFPFTVGPYVVLIEQGTIAVVIEHDLDVPPTIEWWHDGSADEADSSPLTAVGELPTLAEPRRLEAELLDGLWVATLEGLPLDGGLHYRVRSKIGDTKAIPFKAGVSRGRPVRFAAFGDTRTGHHIHRALIEALARERVDFVVHSGDLVEFGGVEKLWRQFFRIESPSIAGRPLFASVGNHDISQRGYFRKYFMTERFAGSDRYFHRDWGDVRVVILDIEAELRAGSAQYEFLEERLAEGVRLGMTLVISLHYPPYSSGSHGSYQELQEVIGEIGPRFGVELVLAGHDHNYERSVPIDGVTYIVAASGGAPIRKISPTRFSAMLRTEPHYVLFDVQHGQLIGRAINLAGDVFDSFVIQQSSPGPPLP